MSALTFQAQGGQQEALPLSMLSQRRVGVAGCGVITPAFGSAKVLADSLRPGWTHPASVYRRTLPVEQLNSASGLAPRVTKKVDRFSLLGVAAARAALSEAGLDMGEVAQCGIVTGNMMAGWTFTETQLRTLHERGVECISPYLATAWFPAAPQGQITINLRMRGFAKTLTTDRCAGVQSIGLAYDTIRSGRADLLLAGGVEAPVTPFVESAFAQMGGAASELVEAAAYLLLSSEISAGTLVGFHSTFPLPYSHASLMEVVTNHVEKLARSLPERWPVKTVVCNIPASAPFEMDMASLLKAALQNPDLRPIFSTRMVGECLAASGAVAAVIAHEMLKSEGAFSSALVLSVGHQCGDLLWMYHAP
ncbi:MAG TPA: beta-ketoacyl synthase N-terminal-like domain-containing protein [Pyrinomonadaceae bacterium]|jgi:hypothetical protein